MKVRRTCYACFYAQDEPTFDIAALLSGQVPEARAGAGIVALAILTGEQHRLTREAFELLLAIPADRWTDTDASEAHTILALIQHGLLLSDAADDRLTALRARDEALTTNQWNLYAALYHYMTQWSGVQIDEGEADPADLSAQSRAAAQALLAEHGPPPEAFPAPRAAAELALPAVERSGDFYRALMGRRTTRSFDPDQPMALEELDTVLRYVFGCHGYARNAAGLLCIKRTSPSGGGLHPIDAYPIVHNVTGVTPGIYHYDARNHSLVMLSELEAVEARRLATAFMCGQKYFGTAHVSFILTARFYRNHWKYRRHQKAYMGILMDAAHLTQTLYLVSSELSLGAFVTMAVNGRDIEARLGIDGVSEGVIAMTGCGRRASGESPLELQFSPLLTDE